MNIEQIKKSCLKSRNDSLKRAREACTEAAKLIRSDDVEHAVTELQFAIWEIGQAAGFSNAAYDIEAALAKRTEGGR